MGFISVFILIYIFLWIAWMDWLDYKASDLKDSGSEVSEMKTALDKLQKAIDEMRNIGLQKGQNNKKIGF